MKPFTVATLPIASLATAVMSPTLARVARARRRNGSWKRTVTAAITPTTSTATIARGQCIPKSTIITITMLKS